MIIYDKKKKNTKVAIFSEQLDILKEIVELLLNENFNTEEYIELDKLLKNIQKLKIVILIDCNIDIVRRVREKNNKIINEIQQISFKLW